MATFNGVNYTKAADPSPANILGKGIFPGNVKVMTDEYTFAGEAAATVVRVAKLPKGAKVLAILLNHASLGGGVTIAVGTEAAGGGAIFCAAYDASGASAVVKVCNLIGGNLYAVGTASGDDVVILTTGGAAATGKIAVQTLFMVE